MSQVEIPGWQEMGIAMPKNLNLMGWAGVINAADYFLGCDSVGQHLSVATQSKATVVLGATYPENVSYKDVQYHTIIDLGNGDYGRKRNYSPIRLTMDECVDRNNEDCMILDEGQLKEVIDSITKSIGVGKRTEPTNSSCCDANMQLPNISNTSPETPKIPKISQSGQSITKQLLKPSKKIAGFNKPKISKKKTIDELVKMELDKNIKENS